MHISVTSFLSVPLTHLAQMGQLRPAQVSLRQCAENLGILYVLSLGFPATGCSFETEEP
jgi:hypothetical protein